MNNSAKPNGSVKEQRSSPVRALIWKEWRQQRWIFILLVVLAYSLAIAGLFGKEVELRQAAPRILAGLVGATAVLILSANAFAGERDENSESFLETIPLSRSAIFWVKLGIVLALVVLGLTPLGAWAISYASRIVSGGVPLAAFAQAAIVIPTGLLILAIVPALIGSVGGSVITTILVSIPVAAGCIAWLGYTHKALAPFLPIRSERVLVLLSVVFVGTLLFAARRFWSRRERTRCSTATTLAVTAGLVISYGVVPLAAAYLYVTCLAPLSFFVGHAPIAEGRIAGVSPTGKYAVANAVCRGWGEEGSRAALVDVKTGRSQWLTRFRCSLFWWGLSRVWTPSGRSFILWESDVWLCPLKLQAIFGGPAVKGTYYRVDARSGAKQSFDELCPGLQEMIPAIGTPLVGWYSEEVFAFQDGRDILFADARQHTVQRCRKPAAFPNARNLNPWLLPITRRGIFDVVDDGRVWQKELCILRFAPELAEAEILRYTLPLAAATLETGGRDQPPNLQQMSASQDGEWLLLRFWGPRSVFLYYARTQEDGTAERVPLPDNRDEKRLRPPFWRATDFLPNSHRILLYDFVKSDEAELALFDTDSRELHWVPLTGERDSLVSSVEVSPEGGFALVRLTREVTYLVVDLRLGTSWKVAASTDGHQECRWLGEEHLLVEEYGSSRDRGKTTWVVNRDGTGKRPLLSE